MIDPGAIPQVGGDLDAVAAAGGQLKTQGQAVSDTGADVHATWQRLAGVYVAPEAGDLLAVTGPVRAQTAAVGGRLASAGAALVAYADEVRPIQAQLVGLRSSASEFVTSVQGVDDWQSDGGKVAEHNGLLSGVSSAVAAWMEAQRRCANAIGALDGGVQYVADNGDGTVQANEYGYTEQVLGAAAASKQGVPWGRPEERDRPWYEDAVHAGGSFGKGLVVDGLWGGVKGIGTMVNPLSDDFGASWAGLAKLGLALTPGARLLNDFVALPGLRRGELTQTLVETGKGLVAWDTWKTDPARAFGATLGNVITAVVGTKGAGAGLKAGSALKDVAAARLAAVTLPKLADIRIAVAAQLAKIPKIDIRQFTPALAGAGESPKPFKYDVVHPSADSGRMHNEADGASPPGRGSSPHSSVGRSKAPIGTVQGALGDAFRPGVHDPDSLLLKKERAIAEYLADRGRDVRPRPPDHTRPYQQNADFVVRDGPLDPGVLTEVKTLDSSDSGAVRRNILDAAKQAAETGRPGDVVIDGRSAGLTRVSAERGWSRALGQAAQHQQVLPRSVLIILADGTEFLVP